MNIVQATTQHLDQLVPLFDGYRTFYKQTSNPETARIFLNERIIKNESVIYMAYIDDKALGYTQLYPIFSSVSMEPMYLLNDLFVTSDCRGKGVGNALIDAAKALCKTQDFKGLSIQTETTNPAQYLYERLGFVKDPDLHFFWTNPK